MRLRWRLVAADFVRNDHLDEFLSACLKRIIPVWLLFQCVTITTGIFGYVCEFVPFQVCIAAKVREKVQQDAGASLKSKVKLQEH